MNDITNNSKLDALEVVNGCFALLVKNLLTDTNATNSKIESDLSYKGKPLGRYKLTVEKVDTPPPDTTQTGKNKELGLPFGKMQKVTIAFDVDGTLRCNCTETCQDPNDRIVHLFSILSHFKNTQLWVWSGGGSDYAWNFADKLKLPVPKERCISKIGAPQMDIAIDDIQDTAIGKINLIVREK